MTAVLVFGEAMAALRGDGPLSLGAAMELSVAGAESNVAIGLSRLGHAVQWVGRVGDDELGELVQRTLRAEGVGTTEVVIDAERPTGLLLFERRIGQLVRVHYYRRGSAGSALSAADVLPALRATTPLLHVTGVTPALSDTARAAVRAVIDRSHELGVRVSFDVNFRSKLWSPDTAREVLAPLVRGAEFVFASPNELALLADDPGLGVAEIAGQLLAQGTLSVVVKHGAAGAQAHTHDGLLSVRARDVPVVDPVGAGDAFAAGYLSGVLDGLGGPQRLDRAVTTAAFAVGCPGDWEGLPRRAELSLLDSAAGAALR